MRIEWTEENLGSFWEEEDRLVRLQVVGWSDDVPDLIVMRDSLGNVYATTNCWARTFRRLEGCDSFEWVEETFPQYRAVYDKVGAPEITFHRRDSETKTVWVLKNGTEKEWFMPWRKADEKIYPQITEAEAFALLDPKPLEEVFPQYWTTIDSSTSRVAYVIRHDAARYSVVYKDGRTVIDHLLWRDHDSEDRKQLTEAEAKALIDKPAEDSTQPVEDSEDWVELTDPEHVLRAGIDWCQRDSWHSSNWQPVMAMRDMKIDEHNFDKWKFRCLRKYLPVMKKTRTVVLEECICWDNEGFEKLYWYAGQPNVTDGLGWDHIHKTGNTRSIEVPL